jgi:peptide/nickel transport system permease protein
VKRYILRRILIAPIILLGMTLLTFSISRFVPTDPVVAFLGTKASGNQEAYEAYVHKYGLDKSPPEQYLIYLGNLLHGDFGNSITSQRPVLDDLLQFFPETFELTIVSLVVALMLGIPLGVLAAARRGGVIDQLIKAFTMIGLSTPSFFAGIVALQVFYLALGWAAGPGRLDFLLNDPPRVTGMVIVDSLLARQWDTALSAIHHIALPAMILGTLGAAFFARVTRQTMIDAMEADFVRTARGKGLMPATVLFRHTFRFAILPTISLAGLYFGDLFSGAIVTETITGWPGVGRFMYQAAVKLDFPAVMGGTLVIGCGYLIINLVVDVLYSRADPRIVLA